MSNLRTVIREEMSKILQKSDDVDLGSRERKDRMTSPADSDQQSEERWYQNESSENVREKLKQIVAEEYETLRDDPETSIEYRSGLREFEVEEDAKRWYTDSEGNVDTYRIEEAAEKATRKIIQELETFRQRAEGARKDELLQISSEMMEIQGVRNFAEDVVQSMSDPQMRKTIQYIDRMHDLSRRASNGETLRSRAETASSAELYEMMKQEVMRFFGSERDFVMEVLQGMGTDELRRTIQRIDREVFDATMGYYQ